jgi:hypothetical protein
MFGVLEDTQINDLILKKKYLPENFWNIKPIFINRYDRHNFPITADDGTEFVIMYRQSKEDFYDFTMGLGYIKPDLVRPFLLKRYNGKHEHTNHDPDGRDVTFEDLHIHTATKKYQLIGPREEHFAEVTDRYSDIFGARDCLIQDCGFYQTQKNLANWSD